MKVAHHDDGYAGTARELVAKARELESEKNFPAAEKIYLKLTKNKLRAEAAFTRLMIIYRKQKLYKKEQEIINTAISKTGESSSSKDSNATLKRLSLSFGKSVGLLDTKGLTTVEQEPIAGWKKRRLMVNKFILKQKK